MKQILFSKSILMGAALLAGTAMFTACSSDEVVQENVNPTFDGESVKTQFAISIPAAGPKKKMTGDNTQQTGSNFLGITNIKLMPLTATGADGMALNQVISLNQIDPISSSQTGTTKVYTDVNVPVGTKNFLFYGEAIGSGTVGTPDAFATGVLKNTLSEASTVNTNNISFELLPVVTNKNYSDEATSKAAVLKAVNDVAGADNKSWRTYAQTGGNENKPLTKLYNEFIKLKAGSAQSVKLTLTDLQTSLATIISGSDEGAKPLATTINSVVTTALSSLTSNTFPQDFNLPDGAAQLSWSGEDVASWASASMGTTTTMALDLQKICYPASLSYFVSTALKATDNNNPSWPDFSGWNSGFDGWSDSEVKASTQAIALTSPINYGVGVLETLVKCNAQSLEDNAVEMAGEAAARQITVPATGFPVTGLLIGGQPDALKWDFTPASTDNGKYTMTIYDKTQGVNAGYNIAETKNYTLVLENDNGQTDGNANKVNVAIELKNTSGVDFYGQDGLIKDDATFYLIGQLDLTKLGTTGSNTGGLTSVFKQDYKTTATFTISSLKNAYNCIPDLRATQLSLGLAVDLSWQEGAIFDVTLE